MLKMHLFKPLPVYLLSTVHLLSAFRSTLLAMPNTNLDTCGVRGPGAAAHFAQFVIWPCTGKV